MARCIFIWPGTFLKGCKQRLRGIRGPRLDAETRVLCGQDFEGKAPGQTAVYFIVIPKCRAECHGPT